MQATDNFVKLFKGEKKPDLILAADIHVRDDVPVCRTDDYLREQWVKLGLLGKASSDLEIPVIIAGDFFDWWKTSPWLLRKTLETFRPHKCLVIPGQHDLPEHNVKNLERSGLSVMEQGAYDLTLIQDKGIVRVLGVSVRGVAYGETIKPNDPGADVLVWHVPTWHKDCPYRDEPDSATALLKRYKNYNLILTGDNHIPFTVEHNGRMIVNPGSMMRMSAGQIDHKPRFYFWWKADNRVEPVYWPIDKKVVSRSHIDRKDNHDERIEAFVKTLEQEYEAGLSFVKNLRACIRKNKITKEVEGLVWKSLEKES